jgi:hypothetical protein
MRIPIAFACVLVAAAASGCADSTAHSTQDEVGAIAGRNAATNLTHNLYVQRLIREGRTDDALRVLESSLHHDVYLMQQAEPAMPEGDVFFRLRDRELARLKRHWLAIPPKWAHEDIVTYVEAVCARTPDCPREPLRPLKLFREPPQN